MLKLRMDLYFYFMILYTTTVYAGTIQKIDMLNSQPAIKGSSTTLACYISKFSAQDLIYIYRSESRLLTGTLPDTSLNQCVPSLCFITSSGRYTFGADNSHVYINITNLNRSEDQKWWTCELSSQRKDIFLTIYTVPKPLQLDGPPNQDQDLAENAVSLMCSTGCTYPRPSFKWFYTEFGGSRQEWSTPGADTDTTGGCTDSERIYTSTLSLARYSTFPGNLNKTVKFTCGIPSFSGMTQPLYTNPSVNIQFAVQVTSVMLMFGSTKAPSIIKVRSGVSIHFTCTTSASRPTATIVWFIGTEKKQQSTSTYTFTPQDSDHNKHVYCKAFNTQPESQALSSNKASLYVQVQVTRVILKDGNSEAHSLIQVTSGVSETLTCTTSVSRPKATVIWYFRGKEQERSNSSSSFTFTPQNSDHDKQIFCKAFNIQDESQAISSNKAKLYVQVQVRTVTLKDGDKIASKSLQVKSGFSTTLTCTPSASRPAATIVWYIGTEERQRTNSNSTFTFLPQKSDNNKLIFCKAFNLQPEEQAVISNKTTLNVLDTSITQKFYIEGQFNQQNVTVDEHDAGIQFKCIVNSNSMFDIRIMFEEDVLVEKVNESSLSFFRRDVSCFDAGVYTCEGSNVYGRKSTHTLTLFVQCSPRPFRQIERNVSSYLYSVVILSTTVIAYPSPGTKGFSWSKEESVGWLPLLSNADLTISSSALQSNLTLMNISRGDFGLYRVTVTNTIGSYEQHIFLSEEKEKQQSDGQCMSQTSEKAALIVGPILGALCCIVIIYATYVTILKNRLLNKVTRSLDRSGNESRYPNPTFASTITEDQRYDGNTDSDQEPPVQQYTDLSRYTNADTNTYDVINKT